MNTSTKFGEIGVEIGQQFDSGFEGRCNCIVIGRGHSLQAAHHRLQALERRFLKRPQRLREGGFTSGTGELCAFGETCLGDGRCGEGDAARAERAEEMGSFFAADRFADHILGEQLHHRAREFVLLLRLLLFAGRPRAADGGLRNIGHRQDGSPRGTRSRGGTQLLGLQHLGQELFSGGLEHLRGVLRNTSCFREWKLSP
mmetsp:Transcript_20361/g.51615  ORF Transcript_20361/g.51615 Transcript_20361/m.51615 type:complete len:200 (+) Transcript_20361:141-740(+)